MLSSGLAVATVYANCATSPTSFVFATLKKKTHVIQHAVQETRKQYSPSEGQGKYGHSENTESLSNNLRNFQI